MSLVGKLDTVESIYTNKSNGYFRVAPYQRNYTWLERHCETLVRDLLRIIEEKNGTSHYLGEVLFTKMGTDNKLKKEVFEIGDGQQRLTSILLLSLAIRDLASFLMKQNPAKAAYYKTIIEEAEKNIFTNVNGEKTVKFELNEINSEVLNALVQDKVDEDDKSFMDGLEEEYINYNGADEKCRIIPNYNYFYTTMKAYAKKGGDLYDILMAISNLYCSLVSCDYREEALAIYISKNTKGRKLSPYENVKALLIGAYKMNKNNDAGKNRWAKIERKIGLENMEDFVTDVVTIINELYNTRVKNIKPSTVYVNTCEILRLMDGDSMEKKVEIFFKTIEKYAIVFAKYFKKIANVDLSTADELTERIYEFECVYDLVKNNCVALYLLGLLEDGEVDANVLAEVFHAFSSRQGRAKIAGAGDYKVVSREIGQKRLNLVKGEIDKGNANKLDFWAWDLVQRGYKTMAFPTDEIILARYTTNELGNDIKKLTTGRNNLMMKYVYYRMNQIFAGNNAIPKFTRDCTLEHIVPEKDENIWKKELLFDNDVNIKKYANKLGNFVLVSRATDDVNMVDRQRTYRRSKYPIANQVVGDRTPWHKDDIDFLTSTYVKLLVKVFEIPEKYIVKK